MIGLLLRKNLVVRIVMGGLAVLLAVGCQQQAPPDDDFVLESPGVTGEIDPVTVIEHFKANNLPVGRVDNYTAETDPVRRLGRPGQYIGKAIFHDERHSLVMQENGEVISFQNSGGIVETFASVADLQTRRQALDAARAQFPAAPPEYQVSNGVILLRMGSVLTPDQAQEYEAALVSFNG